MRDNRTKAFDNLDFRTVRDCRRHLAKHIYLTSTKFNGSNYVSGINYISGYAHSANFQLTVVLNLGGGVLRKIS